MKTCLLFLMSFFSLSAPSGWLTNFEEAQKEATANHRLILLNFSGSDWCGPCIRLKTELFQNSAFESYATTNLVLVNADFPRSNKHKLSKDQVKHNEALAEKYNPQGKFPFTVLLNPEGKILKEWDGLPNGGASQFVGQIKALNDAGK